MERARRITTFKHKSIHGPILLSALLGMLVTLAACQVLAQGARSGTPEIFYQPAAGGMAASLENFSHSPPTQRSFTANGTPLYTTETERGGWGARFAYSFTDSWAVQVFGATETENIKLTDQYASIKKKAGGNADLEVKLTNLTALGSWLLHVAVGLTYSPDKHNLASNSKEGNINSGGNSIVNSLGLSTPVGTGNYWGLKFGYVTNLEKTANQNTATSQDYKIVGGNQTSVRTFFQADFAEFAVDLNVGYDFFDPVTNRFADGTQSNEDAYKVMVVGGGMQLQFFTSYNFRVQYDTATVGERNYPSSGIKTSPYAQSQLSFRLRYEF